jgi:hypothetical protein
VWWINFPGQCLNKRSDLLVIRGKPVNVVFLAAASSTRYLGAPKPSCESTGHKIYGWGDRSPCNTIDHKCSYPSANGCRAMVISPCKCRLGIRKELDRRLVMIGESAAGWWLSTKSLLDRSVSLHAWPVHCGDEDIVFGKSYINLLFQRLFIFNLIR